MRLNPKIRNFRLKETERTDLDSVTEAVQKDRMANLAQIVSSVIERMAESDDLFRSEACSNRRSTRTETLIISSKGLHGRQDEDGFSERMDPRDRVMNVPFHFAIPATREGLSEEGTEFISSELFTAVSASIEDYLVRMLEAVVSVSFNQLMEGKLKENECKDYASKNILLNVHAVCREAFKCLKERGLIEGREKEFQLALIELTDTTLTNAVRSLAPYYPQAPPSGGTPRIRQALLAIDRSNNSEMDFLSTQRLTLERSVDGDYTEYIMKVINRTILVTGEIQDDSGQKTVFEKFKEFMENLIWLSKEQSYAKVINKVIQSGKKKNGGTSGTKDKDIPQEQKQVSNEDELSSQKSTISLFFRQSALGHAFEAIHLGQEQKTVTHITEEIKDKQIQSMRLNREVEMGQKLPPGLQIFGKNDLKDRNFTAKHSSILRVITKWAQNLETIFENPEKFVLNRNYPFTTLTGRSVYPTTELKKKIFEQIMAVREKKNKIHDELIAKNKLFQAEFLTKSVGNAQSITRFIKRYIDTRMVASKMNTLIIRFMQEYLSALIGLLIEAGKFEQQNDKFTKRESEYINLISFRIGDLMRARMHVNQAACIRILHTLYLLDEHQSKENPFFKLVRVKNKLDKQDNNILINFLFRGKLQCELQLSSQKVEGKQQKYYAFSHFLYELSRGSFGILSECAIIISQHDPIVYSLNLSEAKVSKKKKETTMKEQASNLNASHIFICGKCNRLIMNEGRQIFIKKGETENICNQCFINNFKTLQDEQKKTENSNFNLIEKHLSNPDLSQQMTQMIQNNQIRRLLHYGELSEIKMTCLLFSINQRYNKIDYNLLMYQKVDTDWYIIHINDAVLLSSNDITDEDIEIKKLTAKIKQHVRLKGLTYIETSLNHIKMADVINANKKMGENINLVNKLCQIEEIVRIIIARKKIQGILQNKNDTIDFNENASKIKIMSDLAETANNISHIEYVFAESLQLKAIPPWIGKIDKLKLINLKYNKIKDIQFIQGKSQLKELYLSGNLISEINCSNLKNLEKLEISSNKFTKFISSELPSLLELNLRNNQITSIGINCPILKTLNLSQNRLQSRDCQHLPPILQKLFLAQNKLSQLPALPLNLKQLNIIGNYVFDLDNQRLPKSLLILQADRNKLQSLKIENMPNLIKASFSQNSSLKQVCLKNTPQLKQFTIQHTKLDSIDNIEFPEDIGLIILSWNCIKQVKLKDIKSLEGLYLSGNQLKRLELKDTNVKILILQKNNLNTLDNISIPKSVQKLSLRGNGLTSASLKDYPSLQILNLSANALSSIQIDGTSCLIQLQLSYNSFANFDNIKLPFTLQKLSLQYNKLTHLRLSDLPQLITCVVNSNPLSIISLRKMPKLQGVLLNKCEIMSQANVDIPNTVKRIELKNNLIEEISYQNMPNLAYFFIQGNRLKSAKFENIKNLDSIYLNKNQLTELSLKKVPKFRLLNAEENKLTELALIGMPFLKTVAVNFNRLTNIKLESSALIQSLYVSNNQLKQLKLKNMPMLKYIQAHQNLLEDCQLQNLPSVDTVNLDYNQLKTFRPNRLKSLKFLRMKKCPIQSIHLGHLKHLISVEMAGVKMKQWKVEGLSLLKQLKITKGELESLQFLGTELIETLSLCQNQLIKANFNSLPNLKSLDIDKNRFTQLVFINLKQLDNISIANNLLKSVQLSCLPKLTNIVLASNMIEAFILKEVPALYQVILKSNKLKSIETTACKALTSLSLSSNPIASMSCLTIFKPSISILELTETQLETLSFQDYESLEVLEANKCQKLKQAIVDNCKMLSFLSLQQNPVLKAVSIKHTPLLKELAIQGTTPEKWELLDIKPGVQIYVSSDEMERLSKSQNPLQQMDITVVPQQ